MPPVGRRSRDGVPACIKVLRPHLLEGIRQYDGTVIERRANRVANPVGRGDEFGHETTRLIQCLTNRFPVDVLEIRVRDDLVDVRDVVEDESDVAQWWSVVGHESEHTARGRGHCPVLRCRLASETLLGSVLMATLLFFHAHPDDEAIATAGTMHMAAMAGHRVVLVVATRGELGEGPHHEADLAGVRSTETMAAAKILGVARVEFLDYRDSGMAGEAGNDDPRSFWQADVDEAAAAARSHHRGGGRRAGGRLRPARRIWPS